MRMSLIATMALCGTAPLVLADTLANSNATVQPPPFGVRTGANGRIFMNIEGSISGTFASYAVARFDLSADKAAFDALYGAGHWVVTGATLVLHQENAAFSHAGDMNIYFSPDDTTSILNDGTSPLLYNVAFIPGGNSQGPDGLVREATELAAYTFNQTGAGNNGTPETYPLALTTGLTARLAPTSTDSIVTIVFEGQDPTVAATYGGFQDANFPGPTISITAVAIGGCGTADFNCDGDIGTDADIAAFFNCLSGACPAAPCTNSADFNGDGDLGTDADIEAFFRVLSGGNC